MSDEATGGDDLDREIAEALGDESVLEIAKREILTALNAYETDFRALASATREMGFSSEDGLHKEVHKSVQNGEETLGELRRYILLEESNAGGSMINQLIASAVVLTILITALIRL